MIRSSAYLVSPCKADTAAELNERCYTNVWDATAGYPYPTVRTQCQGRHIVTDSGVDQHLPFPPARYIGREIAVSSQMPLSLSDAPRR
jgi:hypothetical protein